MEVFPIPPLSRGRSGGGWDIYVAVVLVSSFNLMFDRLSVKYYLIIQHIMLYYGPFPVAIIRFGLVHLIRSDFVRRENPR